MGLPMIFDRNQQLRSAMIGLPGLILLSACAVDPADRAYLAALRGEEEGWSREKQIAHIDRAIELAPERSAYWQTRAIYRIDIRAYYRARADLDQAILLLDRPYVRFLRGLVSCQFGRFRDALPDFDAAISGQPQNAQFYRGLALALASVGRAGEALADAERLIALAPNLAESIYVRGVALSKLGRDEEAIGDFTEALRRRPEIIYPLRARAASYQRKGDTTRAARDLADAAKREQHDMHCAACSDHFRY